MNRPVLRGRAPWLVRLMSHARWAGQRLRPCSRREDALARQLQTHPFPNTHGALPRSPKGPCKSRSYFCMVPKLAFSAGLTPHYQLSTHKTINVSKVLP